MRKERGEQKVGPCCCYSLSLVQHAGELANCVGNGKTLFGRICTLEEVVMFPN